MIEYKYWIALQNARGVGIATLRDIHQQITGPGLSLADLFSLTDDELKQEFSFNETVIEGFRQARSNFEEVEEHYLDLVEAGIQPVIFFEKAYPQGLENLKNAPAVIYALGNTAILKKTQIAIFGDAEPSDRAEMITWQTVRQLANHDLVLSGGMARGLSALSHRAMIQEGGSTLAIIPCGFLTWSMTKAMAPFFDPERFCIISPFYPTRETDRFSALERNRLLCAMSHAAYIIEASSDSLLVETAESARKLETPLYTTEYAEWTESSGGNKLLLEQKKALAIRGRRIENTISPNLEHLLATVRMQSGN